MRLRWGLTGLDRALSGAAWTLVLLACVAALLPVLWIAISAFLPLSSVLQGRVIPDALTLENFERVLARYPVGAAILRSLLVGGVCASAQVLLGLPAAYALREADPHPRLLPLYVFLMSIPGELLIIPLWGLLRDLGMIETLWALIVPFLVYPFGIFLMYLGLKRLPRDYFEAAKVDGANLYQLLRHVVAPLLSAEMITAFILGFGVAWNMVLFPVVFASQERVWTVQIALREIQIREPGQWGLIGAAALLTALPLLVLYVLFERRIIAMFQGGVKG